MDIKNRRKYPRLTLATPVPGNIQHNGRTISGSVSNFSYGGFFLLVPNLKADDISIGWHKGTRYGDFGEIYFDGALNTQIGGFGEVLHISTNRAGMGLGFRWNEDIARDIRGYLQYLIEECLRERQACLVLERNDRIYVAGHMTSAIKPDIYSYGDIAKKIINLRHVKSADASGVDLALELSERGAKVQPEVSEFIKLTPPY